MNNYKPYNYPTHCHNEKAKLFFDFFDEKRNLSFNGKKMSIIFWNIHAHYEKCKYN